jgi:azurin
MLLKVILAYGNCYTLPVLRLCKFIHRIINATFILPNLNLTFMKIHSITFVSAALFVLISCGGNKETKSEEQAPASSGSEMMTEAPAYDASKINPDAPVMEITLKAQGNTMADMSYDQKEIRVKEGSTIHLTLMNTGTDPSMVHNFVLIEEGTADKVGPEGLKAGPDLNYVPKMRQVLVATSMVQPQQKTELTFPAPSKGSYDYICTYPGHYQKMNGKFIVE